NDSCFHDIAISNIVMFNLLPSMVEFMNFEINVISLGMSKFKIHGSMNPM
ncbi:hypothetical protein L9F63_016926, partial [Diploptera punctata]